MTYKRALQTFQAARIARTYQDFRNDPEYKKLAGFFFDQLYAPEDFSFRDTSIRKLQGVLQGKVHPPMVSAVKMVTDLHELSEELDNRMVHAMIRMDMEPDFSMDDYKRVYRRMDNYHERVRQIELSVQACREFHRLSKMWSVAVSLKTVRITARIIGVGKIIEFIHDGYLAFKTIKNIGPFADTLMSRELQWHEHIFNDASTRAERKPV